jgi:DNA-directed RNA polymerase specialized sigma24 family protein
MLAYVMLGDKASAEDVVQDAFFGLHRNLGRLADPAEVARVRGVSPSTVRSTTHRALATLGQMRRRSLIRRRIRDLCTAKFGPSIRQNWAVRQGRGLADAGLP